MTKSIRHIPQGDDQLLARAREGDSEAFRVIVERNQKLVARTVTGMLGATAEVDDVVQETFIQFYRSIEGFRGDAKVSTYLRRIAVNKALDALRRRKRSLARFLSRDAEPMLPEPSIAPTDELEADERDAIVMRAVQSLPEKHRAVVVLRLIEECSTEETANILGLAYGTVLSRLSRALDKLKDKLAPYVEGQPSLIGGDAAEELP